MERLMSLEDVAEMLGVPTSTLYQWRYRGIGPRGYRLANGRVRYRRADVEQWLAEQADHRDPASAV